MIYKMDIFLHSIFAATIHFVPALHCHAIPRESKFCFVVVIDQNTAVFANFVHHMLLQPLHRLPAGRIATFLTGRRPAAAVGHQHSASFITGRQQFVSFLPVVCRQPFSL
jgi:hypothetical protein